MSVANLPWLVTADIAGDAPANVGVERAELRHFTVPAAPPARLATGSAQLLRPSAPNPRPQPPVQPSGQPALAVLACLLGLVFTATLVRWDLTVAALRRGFWLLPALAVLGAGIGWAPRAAQAGVIASGGGSAAQISKAASNLATASTVVRVTSVERFSTVNPAWARLLSIEAHIADVQGRFDQLAIATQQASAPSAEAAAPLPRGSEDQLVTAFQSALAAEHDFFASIVADPAQRDALVATAESTPAAVRDAVVYDVDAVQSELAQQAAIAAAQLAVSGAGSAPRALTLPLAGAITQAFGPSDVSLEPSLTVNGVTYPHFHTGVDLAAPLGTPVHAAADGEVVWAAPSTDAEGHLVGYGNFVVIAHAGKMVTLYGHLASMGVHPGQVVHAGDVIGAEGSTGYSTGPHVHFEVRIGDLLVDPMHDLAGALKAP